MNVANQAPLQIRNGGGEGNLLSTIHNTKVARQSPMRVHDVVGESAIYHRWALSPLSMIQTEPDIRTSDIRLREWSLTLYWI